MIEASLLPALGRRRLFSIAIIVLLVTATIIVIENRYASDLSIHSQLAQYSVVQQPTKPTNVDSATHTPTPIKVTGKSTGKLPHCSDSSERVQIADCQKCNAFEIQAGTAMQYCNLTGYYSQFLCGDKHIYLPCRYSTRHFDVFLLTAPCVTFLAAMMVFWRQNILDRKAYAQLQMQIDA